MRERTKAYMAGAMDAEGTFCITSCTHNTLGHRLYDPTVRYRNTFKGIFKWIVDNFGGTNYHHKPSGLSKLDSWDWSTDSYKHSRSFISLILPYLIIKKEEAEVLLQFYDLYRQQVPEKRQELYENLRQLKNRDSVTTEMQDLPFKTNLVNAYFAGFFDGEGFISFKKNNGYDSVTIGVGNTDKKLLDIMQKRYGGSVYVLGGSSRPEHHAPMWQWQLNRKESIEKFLLKLLPYLIVKRDKAKVALEFVRGKKIQSELISDNESTLTETLKV